MQARPINYVLLLVAGIAALAGLSLWAQPAYDPDLGWHLFGLTLALSGHVAAWCLARCPSCRSRFYWAALKQIRAGSPAPWSRNFGACPVCGFDRSGNASGGDALSR